MRLAVQRASDDTLPGWIAETRATGLEVTGLTIAEAVARDEAFHIGIARASGNAEIARTLTGINERTRFIRWVQMGARVRETKAEHVRILQALLTRDADAAEAEIAQHIEQRKDPGRGRGARGPWARSIWTGPRRWQRKSWKGPEMRVTGARRSMGRRLDLDAGRAVSSDSGGYG